MTILADALQTALEHKQNDINGFVWKTKDNKTIRMMDMSLRELQEAYDQTTSMLWSKAQFSPGKQIIRQRIADIIANCNAQLFLRYLFTDLQLEGLKTPQELLYFINESKRVNKISNDDNITCLFSKLPTEFENITVEKLLNACFDKLDVLNRKIISEKFLLSLGIWLTRAEMKELTEYDSVGNLRNRMEVIKERLVIDPTIHLRISQNGLSYTEFRAIKMLEGSPKISSIPTATLKLLRDKILLLLDNDLNYHIDKWEGLKSQIERIAEYKNIRLMSKTY